MITKKQKNSTKKIVLEAIENLKKAHKSPFFLGKFEKGKTIILKFKNKIQYDFPMNEEEYFEYKKLERGLWQC